MPYKARFYWNQDTRFPIYKSLLSPILKEQESLGSTAFIQRGSFSSSNQTREIKLDLDINEDFTYEIKSNYENAGDKIGQMSSFASSLISLVETVGSVSSLGGTAANTEWIKYQTWKETEPFRMSFKFQLYTKTDPFLDVYAPAMALSSMTILSPVSDNNKVTFYTPGVNNQAISGASRETQVAAKTNTKATPAKGTTQDSKDPNKIEEQKIIETAKNSSKLIEEFVIWSTDIGGGSTVSKPNSNSNVPGVPILIVKKCFIESAKPTWSKDRTASGIPVWCDLELTVQSIFSANDAMFSYLEKGSSFPSLGTIATNIFR